MAYTVQNYKSSPAYQAYIDVYNSEFITFKLHSPYKMLLSAIDFINKNTPTSEITYFNNLIQGGNSLFVNFIPYIYAVYICSDPASEIQNINKKVQQLKVPLNYFTDGRVLGVEKRYDSVINLETIDKQNGWDFLSYFDKNTQTLKTNDINSAVEAIYYNTLFNYFIDNYYKLEIEKSTLANYTTKGFVQTSTENGVTTEIYNEGKGEAPNFLDISVNAYQKIKNSVSIKASAVRTSYNTNIIPPRQVVLKDTNEELFSGAVMSSVGPIINSFIDKLLLTSLSDQDLNEIINNFILSVNEYFNHIHLILKAAIINHAFFNQYSKDPLNNIFDYSDNLTLDKLSQDERKKLEYFKNNELVEKFNLYLLELILNLLNILEENNSANNIIENFLSSLEDKKSEIINNYKKEELKDILSQINKSIFETFKKPDPANFFSASNLATTKGKGLTTKILAKLFSLNLEVIHTNDLKLEKVYVYRALEKPQNYSDIVQDSNLYNILSLNKTIVYDKIKKKNITKIMDDDIFLIDDIKTNTKYYYCFMSQREYDVYSEVFGKTDSSRIVEHFSAPTKVLELEMISTSNSTYLDYNFFIPEQKEVIKKVKNFLSKIKVSPSDLQKVYDSTAEKFKVAPGLMPFWTNTTSLVNSDNLDLGLTFKLRLTSPKTNKKIDINIRHFLKDTINLGNQFNQVTEDDIKNEANGRKYKEVSSIIQPTVKPLMQIQYSGKINYFVKQENNKNTYEVYLPGGYASTIIANAQQSYLNALIFNLKYFTGDGKTYTELYTKQYKTSELLFIGGAYGTPINVPAISTSKSIGKKLLITWEVKDKYGFIYSEKLEFDTYELKPSISIKPVIYDAVAKTEKDVTVINDSFSIDEGVSIRFLVQTKDFANGIKIPFNMGFVGGTVNALDFDGALISSEATSEPVNAIPNITANPPLQGGSELIINNNLGKIQFNISNDVTKENIDKFYLSFTNPYYGTVIASPTVVINDTSKPVPEYTITTLGNIDTIKEGESITFNITVKDKNTGKPYSIYTDSKIFNGLIGNILSADTQSINNLILGGTKTTSTGVQEFNLSYVGDFSINKNLTTELLDFATIKVNTAKDTLKNGEKRSIKFSIINLATNQPIASSIPIRVTDVVFPTYNYALNNKIVSEGDIARLDLKTTGVPDGTKLKWSIIGPNPIFNYSSMIASDFVDGIMSGEITIINGLATIPKTIKADLIPDGAKYFRFQVSDLSGNILITTEDILVNELVPECGFIPKDGSGILDKTPNNIVYSGYIETIIAGAPIKAPAGAFTLKENQVLVQGTATGNVWGSGPYTSDSNWGKAAVHAGLIKVGEKAIIQFNNPAKLTTTFTSTNKNGITTTAYTGTWCSFNISLVTKVL